MPAGLSLFSFRRLRLVSVLAGLALPLACPAGPVELPLIVVGKTTYRDVRIVSHDARSVFFTYRGGMGSARLRDLPPEVQARLGYDPLKLPPEPAEKTPSPAPQPGPPERIASANRRFEKLFRAYGSPASLAPRVSLQEDFARLDLTVKFQGRRPSCSVYAVVSALEFQFFQLHGRAEDFSEEYLLWATRRSLGLPTRGGRPGGGPAADAGYSLLAVAHALSVYGIALETEMPSRIQVAAPGPVVPDQTLVGLSQQRRGILFAQIPGEEPAQILNNLIHVLNAGLPAPAGLMWSNNDRTRPGWLDQQSPEGGHAVTFVGYECPSCRPEDAVFIFKNSYGSRWGERGYGRATWRYLARNLREAFVIDARALSSADAGPAAP